ncbi:hypothetical protein A4H97_34120 [Niastella yeongjuensis]|uniref:Uncharacterized protein n=1 Tax=Niastella yeongjuensis TaxID=354355 RepID=A0A1V9E7S9_9BACT|nr:hypothetical protein [Niastella yeongjuensis]OQP42074.1 hypothetical protein A4H97_34120 [Niastella yeongjuensis]SEP49432.1 hypothetical protein SAMN05660816_06959 [Niastella yeongjuensis]
MKVKCLVDKVIPEIHDKRVVQWAEKSELEITKGRIYVVFAITKLFNVLFYYLQGDEINSFPLAFPAELFEVIDNRISKYWDFSLARIDSLSQIRIENNDIISFKEWSEEKDEFYEKILEGDARELKIFNFYKDKMLEE